MSLEYAETEKYLYNLPGLPAVIFHEITAEIEGRRGLLRCFFNCPNSSEIGQRERRMGSYGGGRSRSVACRANVPRGAISWDRDASSLLPGRITGRLQPPGRGFRACRGGENAQLSNRRQPEVNVSQPMTHALVRECLWEGRKEYFGFLRNRPVNIQKR
jgi:hypothetical protein